MKIYRRQLDDVFGMANINKKRSGLNVNIWSDGQGCTRNKPDTLPRVKLMRDDDCISVSISPESKVLAPRGWKRKFKQEVIDDFNEGIKYVERNSDLLLKHYMDTDLSFDDEDLFQALRDRGEYK